MQKKLQQAPFSSIPFLVNYHHTLDLSSSKPLLSSPETTQFCGFAKNCRHTVGMVTTHTNTGKRPDDHSLEMMPGSYGTEITLLSTIVKFVSFVLNV